MLSIGKTLLGDEGVGVRLFAISVALLQDLSVELSPEVRAAVPRVVQLVLDEIAQ